MQRNRNEAGKQQKRYATWTLLIVLSMFVLQLYFSYRLNNPNSPDIGTQIKDGAKNVVDSGSAMIHDASETAGKGIEQAMESMKEKRCEGCKGDCPSPPTPQDVTCPKCPEKPKCKEPEPCPVPEPCPKCPSAPICPPIPDDSGLKTKIENQDEELTHLYNENNQLIAGIEQMRLITNDLNKKVSACEAKKPDCPKVDCPACPDTQPTEADSVETEEIQ